MNLKDTYFHISIDPLVLYLSPISLFISLPMVEENFQIYDVLIYAFVK